MLKRISATILALIAIMYTSVNVLAETNEESSGEASENAVLAIGSDMESMFDKTDSIEIEDFNESSDEDFLDYDVLQIDASSLSNCDSEKLVEMMDNGKALCVKDDDLSLKQVSAELNLDEPDSRYVNGAQVTGVCITNYNNDYCYNILGEIEAVIDEGDSEEIQKEVGPSGDDLPVVPVYQNEDIFISEETVTEHAKRDSSEFMDYLNDCRKDYDIHASSEIESDKVYMQLPDGKTAYRIFSNSFTYKSEGDPVAYMNITQYVYKILRTGGKYATSINDVVSKFSINVPQGMNLYIDDYTVGMKVTGSSSIIDLSRLESDASSSYSFSESVAYSPLGNLSGSFGVSTTNSYDTSGQMITNSATEKTAEWYSRPTKDWFDQGYSLEPAIRTYNSARNSYNDNAYSYFRSGGNIVYKTSFPYICHKFKIPWFTVGGYW